MKKKIAISSIILAILVILVAGAIPHYHYDNGAICFLMEHHEDNHATDNDHSDQSSHSCRQNPVCIAGASYHTNPISEIKVQAPSYDKLNNPGNFQFLSLLYLVSDFLINPAYSNYTKPKQGEYILFYTSAEVSRFHGLRAPPFVLS